MNLLIKFVCTSYHNMTQNLRITVSCETIYKTIQTVSLRRYNGPWDGKQKEKSDKIGCFYTVFMKKEPKILPFWKIILSQIVWEGFLKAKNRAKRPIFLKNSPCATVKMADFCEKFGQFKTYPNPLKTAKRQPKITIKAKKSVNLKYTHII